jgi:hypothetical protein
MERTPIQSTLNSLAVLYGFKVQGILNPGDLNSGSGKYRKSIQITRGKTAHICNMLDECNLVQKMAAEIMYGYIL